MLNSVHHPRKELCFSLRVYCEFSGSGRKVIYWLKSGRGAAPYCVICKWYHTKSGHLLTLKYQVRKYQVTNYQVEPIGRQYSALLHYYHIFDFR